MALTDRSVGHGRYRRSVRFHLRDNTVDIDGRFGYTYGELRSISTVGSVHSTQKLVDIDHVGRFIQKKSVDGRYRPSKWTYTQKNSKKLKKSVDFWDESQRRTPNDVCIFPGLGVWHRDVGLLGATRESTGLCCKNKCKDNNTVQWLVPVITLVATASNDFVRGCRSNAAAAGLTFRCRGRPKPLAGLT